MIADQRKKIEAAEGVQQLDLEGNDDEETEGGEGGQDVDDDAA